MVGEHVNLNHNEIRSENAVTEIQYLQLQDVWVFGVRQWKCLR